MTKSWFAFNKASASAAEITIHSDIGMDGISVQDFHRKLSALSAVRTLTLSIQSDGGDVVTGFAIYNMLKRLPAHVVGRVEGLAASMASVILMAADEVVMPSNAFIMIHNPWGVSIGDGEAMRRFGMTLDAMRDNIAGAYVSRTGLPKSRVLQMMDAETWITAAEAVKLRFADRIEAPIKMAAMLAAAKAAKKFGKAPSITAWGAIRLAAFANINGRRGRP